MRKLMVTGACLAALALQAGELKVGFARTDITPPLGISVPGYYQERRAATFSP